MKKILLFLFILAEIFIATGCVSKTEYDELMATKKMIEDERDNLKKKNIEQEILIQEMKDSIEKYSYPADQRLLEIKKEIEKGQYTYAKQDIASLKEIFPHSKEAEECDALTITIENIFEKRRAEEERIKAQGFKILTETQTVKIDHRTCTYSNFTLGNIFKFGYCYDVGRYTYRTADKNKIYLMASMSMTTKEHSAEVPWLTVFKIEGNKAICLEPFIDEYASWTDYGCKLGTYKDPNHDFSKVNTIKYNLAAEINIEDSHKPLLVLVAKNGMSLEPEMTVEKVLNDSYIVKFLNKNKL